MGSPPAVLVLDDGELDDVQQMLQEMSIPFARIRGGAIVQGTPPPRDLLVATPRRIGAVKEAVGDAIDPPIRVMVVNEDSNALRSQLRRSGFDYLVRRPVHAEALRLMILHCAYKGEERRNEPRVAVGFEVSFRSGLVTRRATLADLSSRGCRLVARNRLERGKRVKIWIPDAIGAGEPLVVSGRVMHVERTETSAAECFRLGIAFERLDTETRQALTLVIEDHARGPATLRGHGVERRSPPQAAPAPQPAPARPVARPAEARTERAEPSSHNRRRATRAAYSQTVPAFGDRALRVLVGRDLSIGGMRIQPQDEVELGDRLHLAIYGEPGSEPLLVWGEVGRSDGVRGLMIRFDPLDASTQERMERLVSSLPAVESLHDSEAEAMGTVLSEIVD
jgi:PilZ domain-containing protein